MDRRDFLTGRIHSRPPVKGDAAAARPATGLEPYVPDASQPWDAIRAGHLLRRLTFLPRWNDISTLLGMSPSAAVDLLLDTPNNPTPPSMADHITESLGGLDITFQNIIRGQWRADHQALQAWYAGVMKDAGLTAIEKMTGFYSNLFATEFVVDLDYVIAPLLYRQNQLFRNLGLGGYRNMMLGVTLDGAMLVYLGGNLNIKGNPNENYGREMLELFTTGLGHYTEGDIKEAARILTGWKVAQYSDEAAPNGFFNPYLLPGDHDTGAKQFLSVSFAARDNDSNTEFLVRRDEVQKMIDTIFDQRPDAVATFICRKLYTFFVYSNPGGADENVISQMAQIFKDNDFNVKPVLAALFKSAHFFDNLNLGAQIKTPAEYVVGLARQIGQPSNMVGAMNEMEMVLFDPPNVSGWPGYRDWMTTNTYPIRTDTALDVINSMSDQTALNFVTQFPNYEDVHELIGNVAALLLPRPISDGRRTALEGKLLQGAPDYEWENIVANVGTAGLRIRELLSTIALLPDFHLC
ncbi:MAG: DUF1800 domain-containing protein [Ignavibacteriae bacterium]|nr:DUF1800 domain-containing protein [Ignavibacteriota bacterium]MCB9216585.1 DUF1800 domain-containing protein [Ignavibacteria bacterium]